MKKWTVIMLVLGMMLVFSGSLRAEVQNVRLGGDIRARFYYTKNLYDLGSKTDDDDFYARQLSRVSAEADLTDNVWAVATVEGEGYWGRHVTQPEQEWEVDIAEAYIQLSEIFYSPLTVKVGRQYLNYGRGFLISSREWKYKFDSLRTIWDFYPWTVDLFWARLAETDPGAGKPADDEDLFGVNFKYEADLWTLEGYAFGVRDEIDEDYGEPKNAPVALGIRGDASPVEAFDIWGEFCYEFGSYREVGAPEEMDIRAFAFDVGAVYVFDVTWEPAIAASYTFASGGEADDDDYKFFNPGWNYNYYGYAYSPRLSNIGIINGQLSMLPSEDLTFVLDFFYYMQDKEVAMAMGDPDQDNGGVMTVTNGDEKDLGMELDVIFEYDYTEDVSIQLLAGWFKPGDAYELASNDKSPDDVFEGRLEFLLSF